MTFGGFVGLLVGVSIGGIVGILLGAALTDGYWRRKIEHITDGVRNISLPYEFEAKSVNKEEKQE